MRSTRAPGNCLAATAPPAARCPGPCGAMSWLPQVGHARGHALAEAAMVAAQCCGHPCGRRARRCNAGSRSSNCIRCNAGPAHSRAGSGRSRLCSPRSRRRLQGVQQRRGQRRRNAGLLSGIKPSYRTSFTRGSAPPPMRVGQGQPFVTVAFIGALPALQRGRGRAEDDRASSGPDEHDRPPDRGPSSGRRPAACRTGHAPRRRRSGPALGIEANTASRVPSTRSA